MNIRVFILSFVNKIIPKSHKLICFYGRTALNDNNLALLEYLNNNKGDRYNIILIIKKTVTIPKRYIRKNVKIITNPITSIFYLFRSQWIFHTHGMSRCSMIPARGQIIFNLWHGSPLKRIGKMLSSNWEFNPQMDSYYLSASAYWNKINKLCWGYADDQLFIGSNPRNDYLFTNKKVCVPNLPAGKMVLFMPTYRNSLKLNRKETDSDCPILNEKNIIELDDFLQSINQIIIIKPHPAQNEIPLFKKTYRNIFILQNSELDRMEINLYELLAVSDALISDFSSVYFDYLLLNRPIGFVVSDIDLYSDNRGFTVDDPMSLMPGLKIHDMEDLKRFLLNVEKGDDDFEAERISVMKLTNDFIDSTACKRITDFVNIV